MSLPTVTVVSAMLVLSQSRYCAAAETNSTSDRDGCSTGQRCECNYPAGACAASLGQGLRKGRRGISLQANLLAVESSDDLESCGCKSVPWLRVLSMNLWQEGTMVEQGLTKIAGAIAASKADVVAMSEVRNYAGEDFHNKLIKALSDAGAGAFHGHYAGGDVGLVSRWPISKAEAVFDHTAQDRGSLMAYRVVSPDGKPVLVGTGHLDWLKVTTYPPRGFSGDKPPWERLHVNHSLLQNSSALRTYGESSFRDDALNAFVAYAGKDEFQGVPVILAGDFNEPSHLDWTEATAHLYDHNGVVQDFVNSKMLMAAGFRDSWREVYPDPATHPGMTYPSDQAQGTLGADQRDRIDYIYYRGPGLRADRTSLVGSGNYVVKQEVQAILAEGPFALKHFPWPSDHKAVMTDFGIA